MPQSGHPNRCDRFINLNQTQASRVFTVKWSTPCKRPPSAPDLARSVAANWNGKRAWAASEGRQKSTFSSAADATTFIRSKRRIRANASYALNLKRWKGIDYRDPLWVHRDRSDGCLECPLRANSGHFASHHCVELALLFSLRYGVEIVGPVLGRAKPERQFGHKFVALMEGAYTNRVNPWPVLDRSRIDWRSTIWTKRLLPFGAAFSCLDVYFRFTRSKLK
jgi:hypothetical protein